MNELDTVPLIARLEAEPKYTPGEQALKLCWRLGQGTGADITRLPVDLVMVTLEFLGDIKAQSQHDLKDELQGLYECARDTCQAHHHITHEQRQKIVDDGIRGGFIGSVDLDDPTAVDATLTSSRIIKRFDRRYEPNGRYEWSSIHAARATRFAEYISFARGGRHPFLARCNPYVHQMYSMELWIEAVPAPSREPSSEGRLGTFDLYLCLPPWEAPRTDGLRGESCQICDKGKCLEHGLVYGLSFDGGVAQYVTGEQLARFEYVWQQLGLEGKMEAPRLMAMEEVVES
jgi:hypothetical protein